MRKHSIRASALTLLLLLIGCGAQAGSTVITYEGGKEIPMATAPGDGRYRLYSTTDVTPKVTYKLKQGDAIGFRRDGDQVVAVAGSNTYRIVKGSADHYYWKHEAE